MTDPPDVPTVRLVSGHGELLVVVHRRTYQSADDWWDGNWLDATVTVSGRVFTGSYDTTLRAQDFVGFAAGLADLVDGNASRARLSTIEQGVDLLVERRPDGPFAATLTARADPEAGPQLEVQFGGIAPPDLAAIREQVAAVVVQCPPRSEPDEAEVPASWNEPLGPAANPAALRRHVRRHARRSRACPFCRETGDTVVALMRMDAHGDPGNPIEVGEHGVVDQIDRAEGGLSLSKRMGSDEVSVTFNGGARWTICGPQHILCIQRPHHG